MEQIFVELYKHNDKWADTTPEFRAGYIAELLKVVGPDGSAADLGIEIITYSFNDSATPHRADYDFVCVYRVKSEEQLRQLTDMIEESGWYEYFDQVNASGAIGDPEPVLAASRDLAVR